MAGGEKRRERRYLSLLGKLICLHLHQDNDFSLDVILFANFFQVDHMAAHLASFVNTLFEKS